MVNLLIIERIILSIKKRNKNLNEKCSDYEHLINNNKIKIMELQQKIDQYMSQISSLQEEMGII